MANLTVSTSTNLAVNDPTLGTTQTREQLLSPENIAINDSVSRLANANRAITNNLVITDTLSRLANANRLVTDNLVITDLLSRLVNANRLVTDNLVITDLISRLANANRLISDNLVLTDLLSRHSDANRFIQDNLVLTDLLNRHSDANRFVTDNLVITDSIIATLIGAGTFLLQIINSIGIQDLVSRQSDAYRQISEIIEILDTVARHSDASRKISDNLVISDDVDVLLLAAGSLIIQLLDGIGFQESVQRQSDAHRNLTETLDILDQLQRQSDSNRLVSNNLIGHDTVQRQSDAYRLLTDTIAIGGVLRALLLISTLKQWLYYYFRKVERPMYKNTAGQKVTLFAFSNTSGLPITGDGPNISGFVRQDDGPVVQLTDLTATEVDAINATGSYDFDLTQAETNASKLYFTGTSSTPGIIIVPITIYTVTTSSGTGARTITLTITDGTDPLQYAVVRLTKGAESYVAITDVDGVVTFNVDDGTWIVAITLPGYMFSGDSLVVTANQSETYELDLIFIDVSDPDKVTGYLTCYDENGDPEEDVKVRCHLTKIPGFGTAQDNKTRIEISDVNGLVQFINMIKGATYDIKRGTSQEDDNSISQYKTVVIPTDATDPYALPSIIGRP